MLYNVVMLSLSVPWDGWLYLDLITYPVLAPDCVPRHRSPPQNRADRLPPNLLKYCLPVFCLFKTTEVKAKAKSKLNIGSTNR